MLRPQSVFLLVAMAMAAACPNAEEASTPAPTAPTLPSTTSVPTSVPTLAPRTVVPKFDLGQMKSDPEIARRNQEALDKPTDPAANPFEKPCGDPKEVRCKP